jgi:putative ABC transport system permease protein
MFRASVGIWRKLQARLPGLNVELPGAVPLIAATAVLIGAAVVASLIPAARASRVDVVQALRSE